MSTDAECHLQLEGSRMGNHRPVTYVKWPPVHASSEPSDGDQSGIGVHHERERRDSGTSSDRVPYARIIGSPSTRPEDEKGMFEEASKFDMKSGQASSSAAPGDHR